MTLQHSHIGSKQKDWFCSFFHLIHTLFNETYLQLHLSLSSTYPFSWRPHIIPFLGTITCQSLFSQHAFFTYHFLPNNFTTNTFIQSSSPACENNWSLWKAQENIVIVTADTLPKYYVTLFQTFIKRFKNDVKCFKCLTYLMLK